MDRVGSLASEPNLNDVVFVLHQQLYILAPELPPRRGHAEARIESIVTAVKSARLVGRLNRKIERNRQCLFYSRHFLRR
jgi:hypothetical protein